jgi:ATP-dependent Clp protease ATP-binding subunit ClpB
MRDQLLSIEFDTSAIEQIVTASYTPVYGARPVKRYLQKTVETEIGRLILKGEVPEGSTVRLTGRDGCLRFDVEPPEVSAASAPETTSFAQ